MAHPISQPGLPQPWPKASAPTRAAARQAATPIAIALALAALLLPLIGAPLPPLTDYPNHLARIWLLAGGADLPALAPYYRVTWDTLTNIGIDLAGMALAGIVGIATAGQILVAVAAALPALGGILLWRSLYGRWDGWQLAFTLFAWNRGLAMGFLNFQIALGIALCAAALDVALARSPWLQRTTRLLAASALLLVHVAAYPILVLLLAASLIGPNLRRQLTRPALRRPALRRLAIAQAGMLATLTLPLLGFLLLTPHLPGAHVGATATSATAEVLQGFVAFQRAPLAKLHGLAAGLQGFSTGPDQLAFAALALPLILLALTRRLTIHAGMMLAAIAMALCYLVVPFALMGAAFVDSRFALALPFALAAALQPRPGPRAGRALAIALFAVSTLRTADVAILWHARQADIAAVTTAIAPIPPGARLFTLQHVPATAQPRPPGRYISGSAFTLAHLGALAVPLRHAFIPTLFAARGKQPIAVLPPWTALSDPDGGLFPSVHTLETPSGPTAPPYLADWRRNFDYLLVLNADLPDQAGPFAPPPGLTLLRNTGFAQLFRITPP